MTRGVAWRSSRAARGTRQSRAPVSRARVDCPPPPRRGGFTEVVVLSCAVHKSNHFFRVSKATTRVGLKSHDSTRSEENERRVGRAAQALARARSGVSISKSERLTFLQRAAGESIARGSSIASRTCEGCGSRRFGDTGVVSSPSAPQPPPRPWTPSPTSGTRSPGVADARDANLANLPRLTWTRASRVPCFRASPTCARDSPCPKSRRRGMRRRVEPRRYRRASTLPVARYLAGLLTVTSRAT